MEGNVWGPSLKVLVTINPIFLLVCYGYPMVFLKQSSARDDWLTRDKN